MNRRTPTVCAMGLHTANRQSYVVEREIRKLDETRDAVA